MARLWGNQSLRFYSTIEPDEQGNVPPLELLEVTTDFENVRLEDHAAFIMAANYPSVRLHYSEAEIDGGNGAAMARDTPAVHFFREAMEDARIIKAAPCHALWLLTPSPDLLAGRKVICNPVVLASAINAGACCTACPPGTPPEKQVVVDRDLVSNNSWHTSEALVDAIKDLIINPHTAPQYNPVSPVPTTPDKRRILIVLSEWGYWGEELVGPLSEFDRVGYQVDFCTPAGKRPNEIPVSMDPDFFDPPLQRPVTTPEMAARVREIDDPATAQGKRLDQPISLADWFPARSYFATQTFVRGLYCQQPWWFQPSTIEIDNETYSLCRCLIGPVKLEATSDNNRGRHEQASCRDH